MTSTTIDQHPSLRQINTRKRASSLAAASPRYASHSLSLACISASWSFTVLSTVALFNIHELFTLTWCKHCCSWLATARVVLQFQPAFATCFLTTTGLSVIIQVCNCLHVCTQSRQACTKQYCKWHAPTLSSLTKFHTSFKCRASAGLQQPVTPGRGRRSAWSGGQPLACNETLQDSGDGFSGLSHSTHLQQNFDDSTAPAVPKKPRTGTVSVATFSIHRYIVLM